MIISNSHNFVFLRVPKAASTSVTTAIYDSELVSLGKDSCPGIEHEYVAKDDRSHKGRPAINPNIFTSLVSSDLIFEWESWWPWKKERAEQMFFAHATYGQLVEMKLIKDGLPSFATIRHPVDRFLSIWSFLLITMTTMDSQYEKVLPHLSPSTVKLLHSDPNEFFDVFFTLKIQGDMRGASLRYVELFRRAQTYWGNMDTQYWAIEHIDRELNKLFKEKGVNEIKVNHLKKDRINKPRDRLTIDRQKSLLKIFETDFITWEKQQH